MTAIDRQGAQGDGELIAAVERLAGGIAHDFNNLLMIVSARARFALEELPDGHEVRAHVEEIADAAGRAAHLTRQLLAFGQRQALRPESVRPSGLVRELERQLRREAGPRVEVRTSLADDCWPVLVDRAQAAQVLLNLVANARDAMPEGGRLDVSVENVELPRDAGRDVPPGEYVRLRLADTGHGMDAATRARIFEPFFTTRAPGKGTGLGLSVVHGVVKQSGGFVAVESAPGEGATFDVHLPRAAADVPRQPTPPAPRAPERGDRPTILVCEDEEQVRTVIAGVLRREGHTVVEARNGPEALLLSELQRTPLQLLITDLEMPEMTGEELADRLIDRFPELRVLYVSGYIDGSLAPLSDPEAGVMFLEKPFTPLALASHVAALLQVGGTVGA